MKNFQNTLLKNNFPAIAFIIALLLFHAFNNNFILSRSRYTPTCDTMRNLKDLDIICRSLSLGSERSIPKLISRIYADTGSVSFHPRLFLYTAIPFFSPERDKNDVAKVNLIYLAILLFSTYGIGKKLFGPQAGIFAAFIVSMFPTVFSFSRVLTVDFPVMSMVALTFYLFTLNKFNSLIFSLFTGMTIGFGLLIKGAYFVFLLPMFLYFALQQKKLNDRRSIYGFCLSIFAGLLIAGKYYSRPENINLYLERIFEPSNIDPLFYFYSLNRQLLPVFFFLFLAALIFCYRNKKYFLPSMTVALLSFFSLSPNAQARFILPLFTYIAVMIAGLVWSLPKFRKISILGLVLFSFLQYFILSYGYYIGKGGSQTISRVMPGKLDCEGLITIIDEGDWQRPAVEIIRIMKENRENIKSGGRIKLGLFGQESIYYALIYWSIAKELPLDVHIPVETGKKQYMAKNVERENGLFENPALNFDFIIFQDKFPDNEKLFDYTNDSLDYFKENFINSFYFVKTINLPDGGSCVIYKKIHK